jgi:hypothetical protein
MCATGKTLIDSYSHMLKRLQLLAVVDPKEVAKAFLSFDRKYQPLITKIKTIIESVIKTGKERGLSENEYKLLLLTKLDVALKTSATGFYDAPLTSEDKFAFNEELKKIFTPARLARMQQAQERWTKGGYVMDSKDGQLYPVEEYVFNVSKKREFYDANKRLTPYRINIHNTRAKGQRSSTLRGERYLANGEYTEANRKMKAIGIANKAMHADHFIPLALGGIHDAKNLRPLSGPENIYKKHKLTPAAFALLKRDISYLSHWHHSTFLKYEKDGRSVVEEALRNSVNRVHKRVLAMNDSQKLRFLRGVYPTYKESQLQRIISKHFSSYDDQSSRHLPKKPNGSNGTKVVR